MPMNREADQGPVLMNSHTGDLGELRLMFQRENRWKLTDKEWRRSHGIARSRRFALNIYWEGSGTVIQRGSSQQFHAPCAVLRQHGDDALLGLDAGSFHESWIMISEDLGNLLMNCAQIDRKRAVVILPSRRLLRQRVNDLALAMQKGTSQTAWGETLARFQLLMAYIWSDHDAEHESKVNDMQRIKRAVNAKPAFNWGLNDLARLCDCKPATLRQRFHRQHGCGPCDVVMSTRMELASVYLQSMLIKQVAHAVGYKDYRSFSRQFKQYFGFSPSTLQRMT